MNLCPTGAFRNRGPSSRPDPDRPGCQEAICASKSCSTNGRPPGVFADDRGRIRISDEGEKSAGSSGAGSRVITRRGAGHRGALRRRSFRHIGAGGQKDLCLRRGRGIDRGPVVLNFLLLLLPGIEKEGWHPGSERSRVAGLQPCACPLCTGHACHGVAVAAEVVHPYLHLSARHPLCTMSQLCRPLLFACFWTHAVEFLPMERENRAHSCRQLFFRCIIVRASEAAIHPSTSLNSVFSIL